MKEKKSRNWDVAQMVFPRVRVYFSRKCKSSVPNLKFTKFKTRNCQKSKDGSKLTGFYGIPLNKNRLVWNHLQYTYHQSHARFRVRYLRRNQTTMQIKTLFPISKIEKKMKKKTFWIFF